jgi:transcriptional regulator with XRE-family HTH domain
MGGLKHYDDRHAAHAEDQGREDAGPSAALVDRYVGNRILERRMVLGLSLQQLSAMIGVTYQQAHKYERGLNRITAGRLYDIAQALTVPVGWFFEGLADGSEHADTSPRLRMSLELARNFAAISNEKHQEALSHLARALAAEERLSGLARAPMARA